MSESDSKAGGEQPATGPRTEYTLLTPPERGRPDPARKTEWFLTYALADDLTLRVTGVPESRDRPIELTFRYEHAPEDRASTEHTMIGEAVGTAELNSEDARARLAATVFGLYPGDGDDEEISARLTEALDDLAVMDAAGELLAVDAPTARMLEATVSVEYRPSKQDWKINFEKNGSSRSTTFTADVWENEDPGAVPGAKTPIGPSFPFRDHPERWRACRAFWQRMAASE